MARLGVYPRFTAFKSDGTVNASGTVETYITGTSTGKNTYSDQAATTDEATSFTLDAGGSAERYFLTDQAYRLIIKDSGGTTLYTIDDYIPITNFVQLDGNLDVNGNSIVSSSNGDIAITPNGTGDVVLDGLKWPQADGTTGQVLKTDGSAQLSWVALTTDIVGDTTPQLGGDLDTNSYDIQFDDTKGLRDDADNEQLLFSKTASAVNYLNITNAATSNAPTLAAAGSDTNIDLTLTPKGSGNVTISGLKYPTSDGTANQLMKTDGSGNLSFDDAPFSTASQAQMESASSTSVFVTPGVAKHHPGVAKGWCLFDVSASVDASYNVDSITDNGAGDWTVNWDTDFSSANFSAVATADRSTDTMILNVNTQAAGTTEIHSYNDAGTATETGLDKINVVAHGDQ